MKCIPINQTILIVNFNVLKFHTVNKRSQPKKLRQTNLQWALLCDPEESFLLQVCKLGGKEKHLDKGSGFQPLQLCTAQSHSLKKLRVIVEPILWLRKTIFPQVSKPWEECGYACFSQWATLQHIKKTPPHC